jgi:hypothetical protein
MIRFTEDGETPQEVAVDILGHPDDSFAKQIAQYNTNSFAWQIYHGCGYYAPNRPLWIPGYSTIDDDPKLYEDILHRLEFLTDSERSKLVKLQQHNIDINKLIGISHTVSHFNRKHIAEGNKIANLMGVQLGVETARRGVEHAFHPLHKFEKNAGKLNEYLRKMAKAQNEGDFELAKTQKLNVKAAYQGTVDALNKSSRFFANRLSIKTKRYFNSSKRMRQFARKGIFINDFDDLKYIERLAKYGKWLKRGGFAVQAVVGSAEVYETYREHKGWEKKAAGVSVELGVVYLAGEAFLAFTPPGWIALVATAVVEGIILTGFGSFVEEKTEDVYGWMEREWKHFF